MAGEMGHLLRNLDLRREPQRLLPNAQSAVVVTLDYLPRPEGWAEREAQRLSTPGAAVVSVYARGRDYHRVARQRLARLGEWMQGECPDEATRACVDSAPVFEVVLAQAAGLGWQGKNTLLLSRSGGSLFFLGVLLTTAALPATTSTDASHCGECTACLAACPTGAFVAPHRLDARRCISYLTIEHAGSIPVELRPLLGQRVYGCDDCQRVCPWNKFARAAALPDFAERHGLGGASLLELWGWTEAEFLERHRGSAILRIGYARWRRNLAVGLGNALGMSGIAPPLAQAIRAALVKALAQEEATRPLVAEHIRWALECGAEA